MKYFVGVAQYQLDMPESSSLKDKRRIVKSLLDRIGNSRTMSACEVGANDYPKSGVIAVTSVSSSITAVSGSLDRVRRLIEGSGIDVACEHRWVVKPDDLAEVE